MFDVFTIDDEKLYSFCVLAFAIALYSLYNDNAPVDPSDVVSVLAAAHLLQISSLEQR